MNKRIFLIAISVIVIVGAIMGVILLSSRDSADKPLSAAELLDLGEKYLHELNYEQALVQFLKVIGIEPMNPRGYTGAAEAYIGLGDMSQAEAILNKGLNVLPDNAEIKALLEELEAIKMSDESPAASNSSQTPDASNTSNGSLWDNYSNEQKSTLEIIEAAAESFDYAAMYEAMTSQAFLDLYDRLDIDPNHRSGAARFKSDSEWSWEIVYWDANGENDNERDYWWYKISDNVQYDCQLWLQDSVTPSIAIHKMAVKDTIPRIPNGKFAIVFYRPDSMLTRYEGTAADGLRTGVEIVTDMLTGERFEYQYDGNGYCINTMVDSDGRDYVVGDKGGTRYTTTDEAVEASTVH
jgi:tetratricopeptide (TPR) repeat protein